jgi:hypothetical protein
MPRVGFESTIPVFERAKIIHALDRAATVNGATKWGGLINLWLYKDNNKLRD